MTDIEYIQHQSGFTTAGGIWGSAWWKEHKGHVFSLGQGFPGEYLSAPSQPFAPTKLWIYEGPFDEPWTVTDGEAPVTSNFTSFLFPDLYHALHAVGWLLRGTMSDAKITASIAKALAEEAA